MNKILSICKILFLIIIFIFIKFFSDNLVILKNLFLYKIIEIIFVFIISFCFVIVFDYSKNSFLDKIISNLKVVSIYTGFFILFAILKLIFSDPIFIGILNYLSFIFMGATLFFRDRFIYGNFSFKTDLFNLLVIGYFFLYKFVINILNIFIVFENKYYNFILIAIFIFLIYIIKVIVYSLNIKGIVEYDGKEYPVYDVFRVGYLSNADIVIDDRDSKKSIFFTLIAGKKWFVKPNIKLQIDNRVVEEKTKSNIEDGETIKCLNNYFTIINSKIDFFKKIVLSLSLFFIVFSLDSNDIKLLSEPSSIDNMEIIVKNVDFSKYPLIDIYISDNFVYENLKNNNTSIIKKFLFIVEDDDIKVDIKEIEIESTPVDLVFILDVTGSMYEEYKKIQKKLLNFAQNLNKSRSKIRIGIITFADRIEEMQFFQITDNIDKAIENISKITPYAGGDYKENPYDAIMKLKDIDFNKNSQKVVVLFTDAPPHIKGDKADRGKDFTSFTTEDIERYIKSSSFLFYVVSYERFDEYQRFIDYQKEKFFDIGNYDDFSEIISAIERSITKQIKISFNAKKSLDFYKKKKRVSVYRDTDNRKVREFFEIKYIKKTSFFNSLFDIW